MNYYRANRLMGLYMRTGVEPDSLRQQSLNLDGWTQSY